MCGKSESVDPSEQNLGCNLNAVEKPFLDDDGQFLVLNYFVLYAMPYYFNLCYLIISSNKNIFTIFYLYTVYVSLLFV